MRSGRRAMALCCAALTLAAVLLWVSSALAWYRVPAGTPVSGSGPVSGASAAPATVTGAQAWPALVGVAPVALAGVAAALALAGPARRVLGALVVVLGLWVAVVAVRAVLGPGLGPLDPGYPAPANAVGVEAPRGPRLPVDAVPWLAAAAGLAMVVVGLWLAVRERELPRFGARFSVGNDRPRRLDQDRTWWEALDRGQDPTVSKGGGTDPRPTG